MPIDPNALATGADHIVDLNKATSDEARACAKELATLMLAKKFDQVAFNKMIKRLDGLGYPMANVQNCMLSRYAMRIALGMEVPSTENEEWQVGFIRLGTSQFAVRQAQAEAQRMRLRYDGDEKALKLAVFTTFFPQGDIPK